MRKELGCGVWIVIFLLSLGLLALEGVIFPILWGWFLVPLGVPQIGFWHALGIMGLMTVPFSGYITLILKYQIEKGMEAKGENPELYPLYSTVVLAVIWGYSILAGWLYHSMM